MAGTAETTRVYMRRLAVKHRHIRIQRYQKDVHRKKGKRQRGRRIRTPEERKLRARQRKEDTELADSLLTKAQQKLWTICVELADELGKNPHHWQHELMQLARLAAEARRSNRWNVYLSIRLGQINAGKLVGGEESNSISRNYHFSHSRRSTEGGNR